MPTKKARKKATPGLDVVVVSIVSGLRNNEIQNLLLSKYDITREEAETLIKQAKEKITLASTSSAREELGLSISQLQEIYKRAIDTADLKTALNARKERNRLLNLYESSDLTLITETLQTKTEEAVRNYLEPIAISLRYAESNLPLEELARLTVSYIVNTLSK